MKNNELVSRLKNLVAQERKITSEILNHMREIEAQKIFALMGYPSLFEFCIKELGYSEGAAQRRVSAMRLIKELPEVEDKVVSGALTLSVVAQAQTFFKKKKSLNRPMARSEKLNLLTTLENSSARQCEKTLLKLEPELATNDKERLLAPDLLEIKITVDREFIKNLETLKNVLSHKIPQASTKDILAFALQELVKKKDLTKASTPDKALQSAKTLPSCKGLSSTMTSQSAKTLLFPKALSSNNATRKPLPPTPAVAKSTVYISVHTKQAVWQKSQGQCCYMDPETGKKCESRMYLEIDHIYPRSMGGGNDTHNLQLLCDTHNRLKGVSVLT